MYDQVTFCSERSLFYLSYQDNWILALRRHNNGSFYRYRVIDYINSSYEALHTIGKEYIIENPDIYIDARKKAVERSAQ